MITLINGCSNTAGKDLNPGECWSDLYTKSSPNEVLNIATPGQSNHLICRETIRHLELNNQIESIVIMFTGFYRTEIYRNPLHKNRIKCIALLKEKDDLESAISSKNIINVVDYLSSDKAYSVLNYVKKRKL